MKKLFYLLILLILLLMSGCSNVNNTESKDTYFYFEQGDSWFATYSITKAKSSYYDSLTIQYLFNDNSDTQTGKIGLIEYQFDGNSMKKESSYPQELQGVATFHTGSRMNADVFKITFKKDIELIIKWQDKSEKIKLVRQN